MYQYYKHEKFLEHKQETSFHRNHYGIRWWSNFVLSVCRWRFFLQPKCIYSIVSGLTKLIMGGMLTVNEIIPVGDAACNVVGRVLKGLGHSHNSPVALSLFSWPSFSSFSFVLKPISSSRGSSRPRMVSSSFFLIQYICFEFIMLFIQPCILLIIRGSQEEKEKLEFYISPSFRWLINPLMHACQLHQKILSPGDKKKKCMNCFHSYLRLCYVI